MLVAFHFITVDLRERFAENVFHNGCTCVRMVPVSHVHVLCGIGSDVARNICATQHARQSHWRACCLLDHLCVPDFAVAVVMQMHTYSRHLGSIWAPVTPQRVTLLSYPAYDTIVRCCVRFCNVLAPLQRCIVSCCSCHWCISHASSVMRYMSRCITSALANSND